MEHKRQSWRMPAVLKGRWVSLLSCLVVWILVSGLLPMDGAASGLPQVSGDSDWPMLMHDPGHSGYTDQSIAPNPPTGRLNVKWKVGLGERVEIEAQPIVAYGKVYIGVMNGKLHAVNASSGQIVWTFQAGGAIPHTAAAANSKVYFGSEDGKIYALNADTGQLVWSYQTGGPVLSSPSVVNNVLYIGSFDTYLYALDADTGGLRWRYQTGGRVWTSPAVVNGQVYFGAEDMVAYCLNAADGALAWKQQLSGVSMRNTYPVVSNGVVIFATVKPGVESYMPWEDFAPTSGLTPAQVVDLWNSYYQRFPERRYLFYLSVDTGKDKWDPIAKKYVPFPLPYWGLIIPLVDRNGFAWFPASGGGGDHSLDHDDRLWKLNLADGTISQAGSQNEYMMQDDETGRHTMGAGRYYQTAQMNVGMFDTTTKQKYHIFGRSSWPSAELLDPTPTIHENRYAGAGWAMWSVPAASPLIIANGFGYYTSFSWLYALTSDHVQDPGVVNMGVDHTLGPPHTEKTYADFVDELNWRVEQIIKSGPLRPQPVFWGWDSPTLHNIWREGEAIAALAQTAPYLRVDLQERLKVYLKAQVETDILGVDYRLRARCMIYGRAGVVDPCNPSDLEHQIGISWWADDLNVVAENLNAIWAYANYTGDWQTITDHWDLLSDLFPRLTDSFDNNLGFCVERNSDGSARRWRSPNFKPNLQIAAVQSVYRMAERVGDTTIKNQAYTMLQRMVVARVDLGEYVQRQYDNGTFHRTEAGELEDFEILPWQGYRDRDTDSRQVFWTDGARWEIFSFPTSSGGSNSGIVTSGTGNYSDLIGYRPMFPELGAYLGDHLYEETKQYVQTVTNLNPWWYWGDAAHCMEISGENLYDLPELSTAIFQAKAYVLGENFDTLKDQLPWEYSAAGANDIYRLQNLVALLATTKSGVSSATISASPPSAKAGQTVTYTIVIRSYGASSAETLSLTDVVPSGLDYVLHSLTATSGTTDDSDAPLLRWSGVITDTPTVTISYTVKVTETQPRSIVTAVTLDGGSAGKFDFSARIIANGSETHLPVIVRTEATLR